MSAAAREAVVAAGDLEASLEVEAMVEAMVAKEAMVAAGESLAGEAVEVEGK